MDEQHWGDPKVFRPERFLDSTGKIINDSWFMPFGVGKYYIYYIMLAVINNNKTKYVTGGFEFLNHR